MLEMLQDLTVFAKLNMSFSPLVFFISFLYFMGILVGGFCVVTSPV